MRLLKGKNFCDLGPIPYAISETKEKCIKKLHDIKSGVRFAKERRKKKGDKQIEEIVRYIDENYSRQISLDDIAKTFFISPYYLSRKFKAEVGYTVNQYIQNLRLGKAEQRLAFEDTSIKTIAAECGFDNLKYFYSVFKVKTGHTPNEFRCLLRPDREDE